MMRLHHIGVVVSSLSIAGEIYRRELGMKAISGVVQDDIQHVRVQFWAHDEKAVSIELIEPIGDNSPIAQVLKKGGGLAHLCFVVKDLEGTIHDAQTNGAIIISGPVSAKAFDQRRIAFLYYKNIGVVEFLELARP